MPTPELFPLLFARLPEVCLDYGIFQKVGGTACLSSEHPRFQALCREMRLRQRQRSLAVARSPYICYGKPTRREQFRNH
jgi:hypothetical protein